MQYYSEPDLGAYTLAEWNAYTAAHGNVPPPTWIQNHMDNNVPRIHTNDELNAYRAARGADAPPIDYLRLVAEYQGLAVPEFNANPHNRFQICVGEDARPRIIRKSLMGCVYQGVDLRDQRPLALKCSRWSRLNSVNDNFLRETRVYSLLPEHPNLVRAVGCAWDQECYWLAMELVPRAVELLDYINKRWNSDGLNLEVQCIFRRMVLAVAAMHDQNLCHLDVSLENVLLETNEQGHLADNANVKLIDYGATLRFRRSSANWTELPFRASRKVSTKMYCRPPELTQYMSYYGTRIDLYCLGSCLYSMLTCTQPFQVAGALPSDPAYGFFARRQVAEYARRTCGCHRCIELGRQAAAMGQPFGGASCRISADAAHVIGALMCGSEERATMEELLNMPYLQEIDVEG